MEEDLDYLAVMEHLVNLDVQEKRDSHCQDGLENQETKDVPDNPAYPEPGATLVNKA